MGAELGVILTAPAANPFGYCTDFDVKAIAGCKVQGSNGKREGFGSMSGHPAVTPALKFIDCLQ
jgi:hypothetical protein